MIDDFEIHYLELPKLKMSDSLSTLAEWLLFIRDSDKTDQQALLTTIKQRNEEIKMADDILQRASQDELARAAYQQRRKAYLDRVSSEQYMKKQGLEQGMELGEKANQVKTVKNMLRKEMEMADIIDITGLTADEINKINNN